MQISCNNHTFTPEQLNDLIKYLQQNQDSNQTMHLLLDEPINESTEKHIDAFYEKLQQLSSPLVCSIRWTIANNTAYALNRRQFEYENKARTDQATNSTITAYKKTIRGVKKTNQSNKANQNKRFDATPTQEVQCESLKRAIPQNKGGADTEFKQIPEVESQSLQEMITRELLANTNPPKNKSSKLSAQGLIKAELEKALNVYYENHPTSKQLTLLDIWDNLFGKKEAIYIQDPTKTIKGMTKEVMLAIIKHHIQLLDGFTLDNPPVLLDEHDQVLERFELCRDPSNQAQYLRFSSNRLTNKPNKFTPVLTPDFKSPMDDDFKALVGPESQDEMQEIWEGLNPTTDATGPSIVTGTNIVTDAQNSFSKLLMILTSTSQNFPEQSKILEKLSEAYKVFEFELTKGGIHRTAKLYRSLADILVYAGPSGLLCFLQCISKIQNKESICLLLNEPINARQFATKQGLASLDKLAELSANSTLATWWKGLVTQQAKATAPLNFHVLFNSFDAFRTQLDSDIVKALPATFPFEDIRCAQVALERLLYVIQHSSEKKQTHKLLERMNLGPRGAYHASRYDKLRCVLPQMKVTNTWGLSQSANAKDVKDVIFSYAMNDDQIFKFYMSLEQKRVKLDGLQITTNSINYNEIKEFYYRYLARPLDIDTSIDMSVYAKIEEYIDGLDEDLSVIPFENPNSQVKLNEKTKVTLLYICAVAGSGKQSINQMIAPCDALPDFLKAVKSSAQLMQAQQMQIDASDILGMIHQHGLNQTTCPTLGGLSDLIKDLTALTLVSSNTDKQAYFKEVLFSTLDVIDCYGDQSFAMLNYYKERHAHNKQQDPNQNTPPAETNWQTPDYLIFTKKLRSIYDEIKKNNDSNTLAMLKKLGPILSLVSPLDENAPALKNILKFIKDFQQLEVTLQNRLFEQFLDINVLRSKNLPTLENLGNLCFALINDAPKNSTNLVTISSFKLKDMINEAIPDCEFGRGAAQESNINLLEVFRHFSDRFKLKNIKEITRDLLNHDSKDTSAIAAAKATVKRMMSAKQQQMVDNCTDLLKRFADLVSEDGEQVEREALELLTPINDVLIALYYSISSVLRDIIEKVIISLVQDNVVTINLIKQFFKSPSIIVFAPPVFEDLYEGPITKQLDALQICNPFKGFLLNQAKIDVSTYPNNIKGLAQAYGKKFGHLTTFVNSLTRLRNKDLEDFQACLNLLLKDDAYKKFNFEDFSRVFVVLGQISQKPVVEQLTILLDQWKEEADDVSKLRQVLDGLQELSLYQDMLTDSELFDQYFEDSIIHNSKSSQPFSFQGDIKIQAICNKFVLEPNQAIELGKLGKGLSSEQAIELRKALSPVYAVINAKSPEEADTFLNLSEHYKNKLPHALPFLICLLASIKTVDEEHIKHYEKLLKRLPESPEVLELWCTIFSAKTTMSNLSIKEIETIVSNLIRYESRLKSMCNVLFAYEPYPEKAAFIKALKGDPTELSNFLEEFDLHPYGPLKKAEMLKNLNTTSVTRVVGGIKRLVNNQSLSEEEQLDLKRQFEYVNALTTDHPLDLRGADEKPIELKTEKGLMSTFQLNKCSRETLKILSVRLRSELHDQKKKLSTSKSDSLSPRELRRLTLQWLAVMRVQYYRHTGRLPNSTQMLALIYALDQPKNQELGIETGEGKSISIALFTALQAVDTTVSVPTANLALVHQDYHDKHNDRFFRGLGIESATIDHQFNSSDFHALGGYYGTKGNLANFDSNADLKGQKLSVDEHGITYPRSLVADECDISKEIQVEYKRTIPYTEDQSAETRYEWIYEAVNEFIEKKEFKVKDPSDEKAWGKDEDVVQFKSYLVGLAANDKEREADIHYWESRQGFDELIDDAGKASRYEEELNFFITTRTADGKDLDYAMVVPRDAHGAPQWGGKFPRYQHACLTKSLKIAYPRYKFIIDSEQFCIASHSGTSFDRTFDNRIGVSGTPISSHEEFLASGTAVTIIPPHQENQRVELDPLFVREQDLDQAVLDAILYHAWYEYPLPLFVIRYLDRVLELCKYAYQTILSALHFKSVVSADTAPQGILIIERDPLEAKKLFETLQSKFGKRVQFISGEESNEERQAMLDKAGQSGQITVGKLSETRGTDIEPKHKDGILTIDLSGVQTARVKRQTMGRSARKGEKGKYLAIYTAESASLSSWLAVTFGVNKAELKKSMASKQKQLEKENVFKGYYAQEAHDIQQVVLKQFDAWKHTLLEGFSFLDDNDLTILRNQFTIEGGKLRHALEQHWQALQEQNLTVDTAMDEQHQKKPEDILKDFEKAALEIWKPFQDMFEREYESRQASFSSKNKLCVEFLKQDAISMDERRFINRQSRIRSQLASDARKIRMEGRFVLEANKYRAIDEYDGSFMEDTQRLEGLKKHANIALDELYNQSAILKSLESPEEKNALDRLMLLVDFLVEKNTPKERITWQSLAFSCIQLYKEMENNFFVRKNFEDSKLAEMSQKIDKIDKAYCVNAFSDLADNLLREFDWTQSSSSVDYKKLEHTHIMDAIHSIREEVNKSKNILKIQPKKAGQLLSQLHQTLVKHQQRLNQAKYHFSLGYYFFGYPDPKQVIAKALTQIRTLVEFKLYSEQDYFVNNEAGICQAYLDDFWTEMEELNVRPPLCEEWSKLKEELREIYNPYQDGELNTKGLFVIDELKDYLVRKVKTNFMVQSRYMNNLFSFSPKNATDQLIAQLERIKKKIKQDNPKANPLSSELFLQHKEKVIRDALTEMSVGVRSVEVKAGHTGDQPYYEVVIDSKSLPSFLNKADAKFIRSMRYQNLERKFKIISEKYERFESNIKLKEEELKELIESWNSHAQPASKFNFKLFNTCCTQSDVIEITPKLIRTKKLELKKLHNKMWPLMSELMEAERLLNECSPNLILRRFESLGDLLDFEQKLLEESDSVYGDDIKPDWGDDEEQANTCSS